MDGDYAVLVGVVLSKSSGHGVEQDTTLNEVIEQNSSLPDAIELADEHLNQPIAETVSERDQRSLQFVLIDATRVVGVKAAEAVLPVGDVSKSKQKSRMNQQVFVVITISLTSTELRNLEN